MAIWVDDGLLCGNNKESASNILQYLNSHSEIRSVAFDYFVGLKISHDESKKKVYLSQPEYITKILHRFNMENCQPKSLPADPNSRLTAKKKPSLHENHQDDEIFPYREAVGSLIYLVVTSCPDISFSVNQVAQHCKNPKKLHWAAVKRIISFLKNTIHFGLQFDGRSNNYIT